VASAANLQRLLRPRSVAFVGGSLALRAIQFCRDGGYDGRIYAVHSTRAEVGGVAAVPSVADLPEPPDAAYLAVNAAATVEVVRELAAIGAGGAVAYAAGFAEVGAEGARLQAALVEAAGDVAVLGPNCYGFVNLVDRVSLWPVPYPVAHVVRGAALVFQSGNLAINALNAQRSLPLALVASLGNGAVLDAAAVMEGLLDLDEITGIGLYVEGVPDVVRFAAAAARALERGVPVAAVKAGASELGARLALSHTSSVAGSDAVHDALFDRFGIARADSIPQLLETLKALVVLGPLRGRRLAAFTCSGGESALVADAAAASGLELPPPSDPVVAELAGILPPFAGLANPLDYSPQVWGMREVLEPAFRAHLRDPYDGALLVIDYGLEGAFYAPEVDAAVDAHLAACADAGAPAAVASSVPESFSASGRARVLGAGAVPLLGIPEAVAALAACAALGERRAAPRVPLDPAGAEPAAARVLDEWDSKAWLAPTGIAIPEGRVVARDPVAAADAAAALGFPVALKLLSPELPHKAAAGALRLGLRSPEEARDAAAELCALRPELAARLLVERMAPRGVEILVGARREPGFGLVLAVGAGGTLVELIADARPLLLPASADEIHDALRRLRIWPQLAAADLHAAVAGIAAIAERVRAERERLAELDVNPLVVLGPGLGVVAVDCLVRTV
jgi:acyl-CoA synthetase (NDP forming)